MLISTLPHKMSQIYFIIYISLVYHCLTWMLWSFLAVLQHFSKVRSHWLRHPVYHPDAQQGICHWKSGTATAKVGLESGVPWKKQWSTGKIQTFLCFVSVFQNAVWAKQSWMICSWYSICWICFIYVCKNVFAYCDFLDSCVFDVCIDACTTHSNIHI